jgi:hypothetical protein
MDAVFDPTKFIGAAVVPAVMISACGLFCLALYNRLGNLVARLRSLSRERLRGEEMTRALILPHGIDRDEGRFSGWVRRMLGRGSQGVLGRARLIRDALSCLIAAVLCMALCCLLGGLATVWPACAYVALAAFVAGDGLIVGGLALALWELRLGLRPAEGESRMVETMLEIRDRQRDSA